MMHPPQGGFCVPHMNAAAVLASIHKRCSGERTGFVQGDSSHAKMNRQLRMLQ